MSRLPLLMYENHPSAVYIPNDSQRYPFDFKSYVENNTTKRIPIYYYHDNIMII